MIAVVAVALLFWICVFAIYFVSQGVSPVDFFAGAYEPFDPRLAEWHQTGPDEGSELVREERFLLPEGRQKSAYLEHQVRYRDRTTRVIVKVEPAARVRRRRSRSVRP